VQILVGVRVKREGDVVTAPAVLLDLAGDAVLQRRAFAKPSAPFTKSFWKSMTKSRFLM
jgi:hypothetical protein